MKETNESQHTDKYINENLEPVMIQRCGWEQPLLLPRVMWLHLQGLLSKVFS
jgi:hypothetical protein